MENKVTLDQLRNVLQDMNYNPSITCDDNGIFKIDLGNNQFIYANEKFVKEFHKEMLTRYTNSKFINAYNRYYGK